LTITVSDVLELDGTPTQNERINTRSFHTNTQQIKVSEDRANNKIEIPSHFTFIPPKYKSHSVGEYCVEAYIDRHNNHSRHSNVTDTWLLPRRAFISPIFGDACKRISRSKVPVYKAGEGSSPFNSDRSNSWAMLNIRLPDDISVITMLICGKGRYDASDEREILPVSKVEYLKLSLPGKNLNGVISKFENLNQASLYLTNKFWREVFSNSNDIFESGMLFGLIPMSKEIKENFKRSLRFKKDQHVSQYFTACMKDAINELVEREVFYPVYSWKCKYCGHLNTRMVELLKRINPCDICKKNHAIPIGKDFMWKLQVNKFVRNTLFETDGLLVLWALNLIQRNSRLDSFYYLPQTNIFYEKHINNEVDFLGVVDGSFFIGEGKRSADYFLSNEREIRKFIDVTSEVSPDFAVLAFMQYSEDESCKNEVIEQLERFKVTFKGELSDVELKIMVAEEDCEFSHYGDDFGEIGSNVIALYDSLDNL